MKLVMKWSSNILTAILGVLMVISIYAAVSSRISGGNAEVFGLRWYEVMSGSMEPSIHTGAVIFDKPGIDAKNLKVGDIITFKAPNQEYGADKLIITHRIHRIEAQNGQLMFQTKGDANDSSDPELVPAGNVIGKYDNITIPYLGYYLSFMKTKLGVGLLLILPGFLLIVSTMFSLFREISKLQKPDGSRAPKHLKAKS